jgi:tRNA threonylcarbamoyladenosine modification (KEOPS) complex  Pcc1 subunit
LTKADRRITITLNLPSPAEAAIVFKAFQPEVAASRGIGSSVQMNVADNLVTLCFSARSTATLRALLNSYLRWVMMIDEVTAVLNATRST